jgi:hypothetical protein
MQSIPQRQLSRRAGARVARVKIEKSPFGIAHLPSLSAGCSSPAANSLLSDPINISFLWFWILNELEGLCSLALRRRKMRLQSWVRPAQGFFYLVNSFWFRVLVLAGREKERWGWRDGGRGNEVGMGGERGKEGIDRNHAPG